MLAGLGAYEKHA
jgi:selenocysteine lyase/cysteine desulfurase